MAEIQVDVLGIPEVEAKLDKMPIEVAHYVMGDIEDYLLNVLRFNSPKQFITRSQADPYAILRTPSSTRFS